jgi:carboxyl-terminal processing protease
VDRRVPEYRRMADSDIHEKRGKFASIIVGMEESRNRASEGRTWLVAGAGYLVERWRVGLLFLCCFAAGWWSSTGCATHRSGLNSRLLNEAWRTIDAHYVLRSGISTQALTYGAISGMVDALGDTGHSTFLTPAMAKAFRQVRSGELKGVGVEIEARNGHVVVVAPIDGSPAEKAGLRPGDIIEKVDGEDIAEWPISRVVDRVTGQPGTVVNLTIQDPRSSRTRQVALRRASIKLHDVTWQQLPGTSIAHLRIARFDDGSGDDVRQALIAMRRQAIRGIILDLRNNPGGILDEAVIVASQFLDHGAVLQAKDAQGRVSPIPVEKGGVATDLPVSVLINEGSASASEIVAGALKDARRATLVGEKTFGTGTVLNEFRLSDGSVLLLAVEEWLTPNGTSFWHKGIEPDLAVSLPANQESLRPTSERAMNESQLRSSGDLQLLRALDRLLAERKDSSL